MKAAWIIGVSALACASVPGAETLLARIQAQGERQFLLSISDSEWTALLEGVRTVAPGYLGVAVRVLPSIESPVAGRELTIALQDALARSPDAVLAEVPPRVACGLGSEGEGPVSQEQARAIADRVAARVRAVSAPHLEDRKLACLVAIEARIVLWKSEGAHP
jgi:hypothetical protein